MRHESSLPMHWLKYRVFWPALTGLSLWLLFVGAAFGSDLETSVCITEGASDCSEENGLDCEKEKEHSTSSANKTISGEEIDQRIFQAEQAVRIGFFAKARETLEIVVRQTRDRKDKLRQAISLGALGNAYLISDQPREAKGCIDKGLTIALDLEDRHLLSVAYLNRANYRATFGNDRQSVEADFEQAIALAEEASRKDLAISARLNRSYRELRRPVIEQQIIEWIAEDLEIAERDISSIRDDQTRIDLWLTSGQLWSNAYFADPKQERFAARAYQAFDLALDAGKALGKKDVEASSLGLMGQLYERADQFEDALRRYRQAEVTMWSSDTPSGAYPWSWRLARLSAERDKREEALAAYARAVNMTEAIRLSTAEVYGNRDFAPTVLEDTQVLLAEYLELLFDEQHDGPDDVSLKTIRDAVEQQREVEVQTFFQDDCIVDLRSRIKDVDQDLDPKTALIYPVLLKRGWILLVEIDGKLKIEPVDTTPESLAQLANDFKQALQENEANQDSYMRPGRSLYQLLIEPIRVRLHEGKIDTLVFVPSGPLRSLPMAALHDGENFLISNYAVVIAPGLKLLDSKPLSEISLRVLFGGLTTVAQGYDPLPYVKEESKKIIQRSIPVDILEGTEFVETSLQRALNADPYTVVHIASHAEIGTSASDSFIVTHDGKLDFDGLEDLLKSSNFRDQPVELLMLSACRTANDRAALGLAGLAVKSGARSAIGTLWPVADRSSPIFMEAFYKALASEAQSTSETDKQPPMTKAKALQQAQMSMIDQGDEEFRHPFFWAPYILIGSWL